MTLAFRDPSIPDSPLARWDPRWKLAAILLAVCGFVSLRWPLTTGIALAACLLLGLLARVSVPVLVGRVGMLAFGVVPFLILVPITQPRTDPGWDLGWFHLSETGLASAAAIGLRVIAVGLLALVLLRSAPLSHTLAAAHSLRLPGVLVQVATLAYRYTFLLASEFRRTRVALRARGFQTRTSVRTYRTLGHAVGSMLVRSSDRADRVADAMRCRGFDGTYHSPVAFRTSFADMIGFLLLTSGIIALILLDRLSH